MPETPYCPLLSINKEVPVLCQEELCMWYVKQLKLCSITVLAYTNAINLQGPQVATGQTPQVIKPQSTTTSTEQIKKPLTKEQPKQQKQVNPFAFDDLD